MIKETKYKYIVTKGIKIDFKGDEMSYKKTINAKRWISEVQQ